MDWRVVVLWTDVIVWLLVLLPLLLAWRLRANPGLLRTWKRVFADPAAFGASVVLLLFLLVAVADSLHFRRALPASTEAGPGQAVAYSTRTESLLDVAMARQVAMRETSYSSPLAYQGFTKETVEKDGASVRDYPRLDHGGAHLADPATQWRGDVIARGLGGALGGVLVATLLTAALLAVLSRGRPGGFKAAAADFAGGHTTLPWRAAIGTVLAVGLVAGPIVALAGHYHVFGTDRTGNDVLYQAMKSVRTAFVIGSLATIATLPFAVALGILAGYLKGWVDELIQYLYTTLSSVPNVLLIAACVLMMQVYIDEHPELFETGAERADLRLFLLCVILGVTGWASLCRLLRAETLKLREMEYVQAAQAFGVGRLRIMARHILPNVMHLVLITTVLDFSALVLYEAVLSYVGVGVDPSMNSFGGMINLARSEMSRDPLVWWSFAAAFGFMVVFVLAANLFADGVRDAFDPRARRVRPVRRVATTVG